MTEDDKYKTVFNDYTSQLRPSKETLNVAFTINKELLNEIKDIARYNGIPVGPTFTLIIRNSTTLDYPFLNKK